MADTRKILVTGGSGYIAGFLIRQLIENGWEVHSTIRNLAREGEVRGWLNVPADKLQFFAADLMSTRVGGFTFSWLVLGVLFFPFVWVIAGIFIRRSIALEEAEVREVRFGRRRVNAWRSRRARSENQSGSSLSYMGSSGVATPEGTSIATTRRLVSLLA